MVMTCVCEVTYNYLNASHAELELLQHRRLTSEFCDASAKINSDYQRYFETMSLIYQNKEEGTCLPVHKECGWPNKNPASLPTLVLSVGLEGAGHHLWTEIFGQPIFDCVWINARHYHRDIAGL
jgi:hypothetical protein